MHMITDSKQYVLQFDEPELQLIKSALLFYCYEFINADYSPANINTNKKLASEVLAKMPFIKTKDIYILKFKEDKNLEEMLSFSINDINTLENIKELVSEHPELLEHQHII